MNKLSKSDLEKRLAEYKNIYGNKPLFYTEDGNVFLDKSPAIDHARKTKQKWFEAEVKKEAKLPDTEAMTKEKATELILDTELSDDMDYKVAIELVSALELKPASNKKDDLLVALEEYKTSIKV